MILSSADFPPPMFAVCTLYNVVCTTRRVQLCSPEVAYNVAAFAETMDERLAVVNPVDDRIAKEEVLYFKLMGAEEGQRSSSVQ